MAGAGGMGIAPVAGGTRLKRRGLASEIENNLLSQPMTSAALYKGKKAAEFQDLPLARGP